MPMKANILNSAKISIRNLRISGKSSTFAGEKMVDIHQISEYGI